MNNPRVFLLLIFLVGCSTPPPQNEEQIRTLVEASSEPRPRELDLKVDVVATEVPADPGPYRLGPHDVLDVQVEDHPHFSVRSRNLQHMLLGFRIQDDGKVYLPLLGGVPAAGKTVLELQADLVERLQQFLDKPNVAVDVLSYDSQKFYILGAVNQPGAFPADGRATLLEALGRTGGIIETGDIEGAFVVRDRSLLPVSLGDLLLRGDTSRNIVMQDRDLVYVPLSARRQVYVLGDVVEPGIIPIPHGGLDLAGAIAAAGGLDLLNADENLIRIFRGSWQAPRVFTVSAEDVYRYGPQILLEPGDCIHVAPRKLATWNRTLTLMLPVISNSLSAAALGVAISR